MAQMMKDSPAMKETEVESVGQEDSLEKGMTATLVFLPGKFHGQRSRVGYSPRGHKESDMIEQLTLSLYIGEKNLKSHTYMYIKN